MFGFLKRRQQEKAKAEVLRIGSEAVATFNTTLEKWLAVQDARRTMLEDMFLEELTKIEPIEGVSFEMAAELNALAMVKNWVEGSDGYIGEFWQMMDPEAAEVLRTVGVTDEMVGHLNGYLDDTNRALNEFTTDAIREAVIRRGEIPEGD